jgi:uncharacterized membrane protein HdeD (DUF308 family)
MPWCGGIKRKGKPFMFKSTSTSLILLGILAVIAGIIAIAWPGVTVLTLVIVFAVYAFLDAGLEAARAFSSRTAGPVFSHLLLGLISLAAGVVAVVWPAPTALVLVLVIGFWAVAGGIVEIVNGFGSGETAGTRRCSSSPGWCRWRSGSCCSPAQASARLPSRCCSACSA